MAPAARNEQPTERQRGRKAVDGKNWRFIGSDDGTEVNTTLVRSSPAAISRAIEPESYLHEVV